MIDDRTANYLLAHIACDVIDGMRNGKTLEEIDEYSLGVLRKKDRIALYKRMVELRFGGEEGDAIAAHLHVLKRRKPTPSPATLLKAAGQTGEQYQSPTNVTLVRSERDLILIDMGSGDRFMPSAGKLWDNLKAADSGTATMRAAACPPSARGS